MFKKLTSILFLAPLFAFGQNLGLGDFHQGGFVFHIDSLGKGLLLDVDYLEATYPWDTQNNTVSDWGPNLHYCEGTEYEVIGAGKHNTYVFSIHHPEGHYAANLCSNSTSGGFDDWFLPSKDELNQMYRNKATINTTASANGGSNFSTNFYWSSTEGDTSNAWKQDFFSGSQSNPNKDNTNVVRAVRAF